MDADHLFKWDREEGKGIAFLKVLGSGKGKAPQVVEGTDIPGVNPGVIQSLFI